jgi:hypothetical protein
MLKRNNFDTLFEKIVNKFLKNHISDLKSSIEKSKRMARFDEDLVIVNTEEMIDFINFNIFMERDHIQNEKESNNETNIPTLSDFIQNQITEEPFLNNENQYTKEELKNYIFELSKSLSFNFFEKNENIIITFN